MPTAAAFPSGSTGRGGRRFLRDVDATTDYVADHLATGDAVLVMGAGKSYRIARGLAERLAGERTS